MMMTNHPTSLCRLRSLLSVEPQVVVSPLIVLPDVLVKLEEHKAQALNARLHRLLPEEVQMDRAVVR